MTCARTLAALSAAALTSPFLASAPAAAGTDPFLSYDRPATYEVRTERVSVPLRDGSHLACDLHRPAAEGRFPAIVHDYTAYDDLDNLALAAAYFVARGYNVAACNARGSGDSPGHLDPFSGQEQRDNYDLIEWLAVQPWSTGKVGQMGVSYGAHASLLVAVNKPPHLTAIIPIEGISDWYENTIYRGGIYSARIRDWQRSTAPDTLTTYARHPLYDDFWRERSVKARWKNLDIPVLEIAGWYDRYRQGMVENFQARPRNVWLVAGPWQHGLPYGQPADIGFGPYLAWWDRWLGGRRDAPLPAAKVTSYEIPSPGAGTGWKRFSTWPPRGARQERLSLAADGTLSSSPSAATTRGFTVNTETTPASPDEKLTFQTRPRQGDLVLAGEVTAKVRAAFTATDGNIAVIVEDVAPDGTSNRSDLPGGRAVLAQGSHWNEARRNTHQAIVELLGVEPHTVGVHLIPDDPEIVDVVNAVTAARTARADAEQAERDAVTSAARLLTRKKWSTRDAGGVLSLSPQRISQLAPRDTA